MTEDVYSEQVWDRPTNDDDRERLGWGNGFCLYWSFADLGILSNE